jgi:UDP-N-acetylmuramoyl-L-alanyl-D-glutamate--2,6-diaminopimelate ligase
MRLSELLQSAGLKVRKCHGEADVTDVVADSRRCRAGSCFVAVHGTAQDGSRFIPAALAGGATAVVGQDELALSGSTAGAWAVVDDTRQAVAYLAQAIRGWPARKMICVGITGTNGKTTTAHLIREILIDAGHRPAMLGTITYETGQRKIEAATTTPDPITLADLMAEMVADGRTHLVMETSSHALDQRRTAGLEFRVGVFTNLTGDHQDYHGDMASYLAAKRRLFESLPLGAVAVVNRDDPAGAAIAAGTAARVCWYGLSPAADLWATIDRADASGTDFTFVRDQSRLKATTPLIGRHNVYNCLSAAAACEALGVGLGATAATQARFRLVAGRLQRVEAKAPFTVFVDYAHTDDALSNVLNALRPLTRGRLILVFGCGGDRDRTKRPRMAHVAEELADAIVITSDNPRSEQPEAIIKEILAGLSPAGRGRVAVEPDRRAAIERAISQARQGDIVLIAGKGHENYQIVGTVKSHFDDVETAAQAIAASQARSAGGPR